MPDRASGLYCGKLQNAQGRDCRQHWKQRKEQFIHDGLIERATP